jgi:ArsR family transcriptional regulator, arsenate/arsenite/antimonite-responsive transcriptional repressor
MDLVQIYQCFCDRTRLRILNLLTNSPLCVCHFQTILGEPQVKISKHLGYLRERGLVEVERDQNWMVYSLPKKRSSELETNLKCLQDCVQSDIAFARDLGKLTSIQKSCCDPKTVFHKSAPDRRRYGKAKRPVHLRS